MSVNAKRFLAAFCIAIAMTVVTWLAFSGTGSAIDTLVTWLNLPALALAFVVSGASHEPGPISFYSRSWLSGSSLAMSRLYCSFAAQFSSGRRPKKS
jgi:hypothetical protein